MKTVIDELVATLEKFSSEKGSRLCALFLLGIERVIKGEGIRNKRMFLLLNDFEKLSAKSSGAKSSGRYCMELRLDYSNLPL